MTMQLDKASFALSALDLARIGEANRQAALTRRSQALLAAAGLEAPERHWYALQTVERSEATVEKCLINAGIEALVLRDEGEVVVRRGRKWERPPQPWVPGYVMVRCVRDDDAFKAFLRVKGVVDIVGGLVSPWRVRDRYIVEFGNIIEQRMAAEKAAREAEEARKAAPWLAGDKALVLVGPFGGFGCVVSKVHKGREGRCTVSVDVFGRLFTVRLPLASLEKL